VETEPNTQASDGIAKMVEDVPLDETLLPSHENVAADIAAWRPIPGGIITSPELENIAPLTGAPVDASQAGNKMAINVCAACQGSHRDIDIHEFQTPQRPWTHWYTCPTLGDPCPVALAQMRNGEGMNLDGDVCQSLAAAQQSGQWLVAVFWIDEERRIQCRRSVNKLPLSDVPRIVQMFKDSCQEIIGGAAQPEQMAEAPKLSPIMSLYGDGHTPLS
jgi:hypothetical protein